MNYTFVLRALLLLALFGMTACGNSGQESADSGSNAPSAAQQDELTPAQLEKGIGPIATVELAALDPELAQRGEGIFSTKCAACHKMDERYVGPPLGEVLGRREPEFVMNMMLNPDEMVKKHPVVRELLQQYMTPMPNQNLTEEDARAVLEYLRQVQDSAAQ